jgi:hypothetical protein
VASGTWEHNGKQLLSRIPPLFLVFVYSRPKLSSRWSGWAKTALKLSTHAQLAILKDLSNCIAENGYDNDTDVEDTEVSKTLTTIECRPDAANAVSEGIHAVQDFEPELVDCDCGYRYFRKELLDQERLLAPEADDVIAVFATAFGDV